MRFTILLNVDPKALTQREEKAEKAENVREAEEFIVGLLEMYAPEKSGRELRAVLKLARLFEAKREFRHAIAFYLRGGCCSEAMRLLEEHIYAQAVRGNVRRDEAAEWLRAVKAEFEDKVYFDLAKRCIEMLRAVASRDLEVQAELELSRLALLEEERLGTRLRERAAQLRADKSALCDWARIQDEV